MLANAPNVIKNAAGLRTERLHLALLVFVAETHPVVGIDSLPE
jgi:hypothetical protein